MSPTVSPRANRIKQNAPLLTAIGVVLIALFAVFGLKLGLFHGTPRYTSIVGTWAGVAHTPDSHELLISITKTVVDRHYSVQHGVYEDEQVLKGDLWLSGYSRWDLDGVLRPGREAFIRLGDRQIVATFDEGFTRTEMCMVYRWLTYDQKVPVGDCRLKRERD